MVDFNSSPQDWWNMAGYHKSYDGLLKEADSYPPLAKRAVYKLVARLKRLEPMCVNYNLTYDPKWDSYMED